MICALDDRSECSCVCLPVSFCSLTALAECVQINSMSEVAALRTALAAELEATKAAIFTNERTHKLQLDELEKKFLAARDGLQAEAAARITNSRATYKLDVGRELERDSQAARKQNEHVKYTLKLHEATSDRLQKQNQDATKLIVGLRQDLELREEQNAEYHAKSIRQTRRIDKLAADTAALEASLLSSLQLAEDSRLARSRALDARRAALEGALVEARDAAHGADRAHRGLRRQVQGLLSTRQEVDTFFLTALAHTKDAIKRRHAIQNKEKALLQAAKLRELTLPPQLRSKLPFIQGRSTTTYTSTHRHTHTHSFTRTVSSNESHNEKQKHFLHDSCSRDSPHLSCVSVFLFPGAYSPSSSSAAAAAAGAAPSSSSGIFSSPLALGDLTLTDREKVLRLLYAKISHVPSGLTFVMPPHSFSIDTNAAAAAAAAAGTATTHTESRSKHRGIASPPPPLLSLPATPPPQPQPQQQQQRPGATASSPSSSLPQLMPASSQCASAAAPLPSADPATVSYDDTFLTNFRADEGEEDENDEKRNAEEEANVDDDTVD